MYTTLYYNFDIVKGFPFTVSENLQDIIEYKFEEKYGKPYNNHNWWLEEGATEFVKDLENKWWHNEIDTIELYSFDSSFKDWLTNKYYDEAIEEATSHCRYVVDAYSNDSNYEQLSIFDFIEEED